MILIDLENREIHHWVVISSIIISPTSLFKFFFPDACIMTRAAVFLNRFFYKVWFFGACYYWGTWVFLVVSFDIILPFLGFPFCESIWKAVNWVVTKKTIWSSLTDLMKNERFSSLNKLWCSIGEKVNTKIWYQMLINREYYMPARRYEFYLRMVNSISHYRVEHEKIKFISISEYVIFCLLYKHQWNTKSACFQRHDFIM